MIVVHVLTEDDTDVVQQTMEKYKTKMARSASQNPIIEDVEYGIDSRRSSMNQNTSDPSTNLENSGQKPPEMAKNFEQEMMGGVVKV